MNQYEDKVDAYFASVREDLIQMLPNNPNQTVLEIGAGSGDSIAAIKQRKLAREVVGVELFNLPNTNQQNPIIDRFIIQNVEEQALDLPQNYYDAILCGDVLEHLVDPWQTVQNLTSHLKPNGLIIVSCPNIREIVNWGRIFLLGDFRYAPSGVLDKTHLRFFCKKNLVDLLTTDKLKPVRVRPNYHWTPRRKLAGQLLLGSVDQFLAPQYIVVSQKKG